MCIKDTQCITPCAVRIIKSIWQSDLEGYLLWFYVLPQMWCSCNYCHGSAVKICSEKRKNSGLFICVTAVYSGELGPLNLQLCRVTKVRNLNLSIFQTVQIVLESQNRGNIGSVFLLWIKARNGWLCSPEGSKRGERISPSFCSHDTRHDIHHVHFAPTEQKDIYA